MVKVKYKDGTTESFDANFISVAEECESMLKAIKRKFDEDNDYNEEDDTIVAWLNPDEVRAITI